MDSGQLDTVQHRARAVLSRFLDASLADAWADMVLELRPKPEDYERVFVPEIAASARKGYAAWWAAPAPLGIAQPAEATLLIAVARSDDFSEPTERAQKFPGGYAEIAKFLRPGVPWVCWKFLTAERPRGTAFDGLVDLDGRWAWFPKPYKVLMAQRRPYAHFIE